MKVIHMYKQAHLMIKPLAKNMPWPWTWLIDSGQSQYIFTVHEQSCIKYLSLQWFSIQKYCIQ